MPKNRQGRSIFVTVEEEPMKNEIRTALITGASRGLGLALADQLASRGVRVAMVARHGEEIERVAAAIRAKGGAAFAIPGDVGVKEDIHRIAGAANGLVGPIDLLVHNASTLGPLPMRTLIDTACEDFEQVLQVNLVGPFRLTKVIAGAMALHGGGLVVHLSSDAAVNGYAHWGAYGISKAALDQLGRVWAAELEDRGVRFVSVDPGEMDTQMHADAMPDADRNTLARPETVAARIIDMIFGAKSFAPGARVEASNWQVSS
jgi:NAD(P)-dependent dehydrogenase (short-subunit alcohol dehydrogenase family)